MPLQRVLALLLLGVALPAFADLTSVLDRADALDAAGRHRESVPILEDAAKSTLDPKGKGEVLWRLSRAWFNLADDSSRAGVRGAELLGLYEKGEALGQAAIDADPSNARGYFWKAANSGRWGQLRGVFNALAKVKEMQRLLARAVELDPTDRDSFYVLGQMYEQVPGFPIGFGDVDHAVSLGRRSVDLMERAVSSGGAKVDYTFYTELAAHLIRRNWDAARRMKSLAAKKATFDAAQDELTRGLHFEGTVRMDPVSDREEARALLAKAVAGLRAMPRRSSFDDEGLARAEKALAALQ
jgi:tetratricopeptide (TPR) repeat protein